MRKRYYVIRADNWRDFEKECEEFLNKDWTPVGGVCVDSDTEGYTTYYQAFTKME